MSLLKHKEKKYLYLLILLAFVFSLWFYLGITSKDRFVLAHGYGSVSQAKEMISILGIAFAFIFSLVVYQSKKTNGYLFLTIGLGLLLTRSLLHSTHMINAMEQNSSFFEAIFEGENHFLLSIFDTIGAILLALGILTFLDNKMNAINRILQVMVIEVGIFFLILVKSRGDAGLLLNNMVVSHGMALLPVLIAIMPVFAFLALIMVARELYKEKDSEFARLLFIGLGLIFLRALVHGVHNVFGLETHFFQSGFDLLGGIVTGLAYYTTIDKREDSSPEIWAIAGTFLIFALSYSAFTFFRFR